MHVTRHNSLSKAILQEPCRADDAGVGRGKAEWTTSKSAHPCLCQNCSQGPPAEKTGRGSRLNRPSYPPGDPVGHGTELILTAHYANQFWTTIKALQTLNTITALHFTYNRQNGSKDSCVQIQTDLLVAENDLKKGPSRLIDISCDSVPTPAVEEAVCSVERLSLYFPQPTVLWKTRQDV